MPLLKPVNGTLFIKYLHAGLYAAAAGLECHSCENFLSRDMIDHAMRVKRCNGYVVTDVKKPVGYILYRRDSRKKQVVIRNVVVHSDYRRRGIGTMLLEQAKPTGDWRGLFQSLTTRMRETNLAAQLFFRQNGFTCTGVERGLFRDEYPEVVDIEDAFTFKLDLEQESGRL